MGTEPPKKKSRWFRSSRRHKKDAEAEIPPGDAPANEDDTPQQIDRSMVDRVDTPQNIPITTHETKEVQVNRDNQVITTITTTTTTTTTTTSTTGSPGPAHNATAVSELDSKSSPRISRIGSLLSHSSSRRIEHPQAEYAGPDFTNRTSLTDIPTNYAQPVYQDWSSPAPPAADEASRILSPGGPNFSRPTVYSPPSMNAISDSGPPHRHGSTRKLKSILKRKPLAGLGDKPVRENQTEGYWQRGLWDGTRVEGQV